MLDLGNQSGGQTNIGGADRSMPDASVTVVGIVPALVTPFDEDESLDLDALTRVVERVIAAGVHGIFAVGSQGEFYALSPSEQRLVIEATVEASAGRVPIYAGTSALTTRDAIALARSAEAAGANAITLLPPFFVKPSERELETHFQAVADSVGIPLILYNHPARTGTTLSIGLIERLANSARVVAVKDSSADFTLTCSYITQLEGAVAVLIGNDAQIAFGLIAGAVGAVASTANVVPELCVGIYDAVQTGDLTRARTLQADLATLRAAFELGTFPSVVKEALALLGEPVGRCRAPIGSHGLTAQQTERLRTLLEAIGAVSIAETA
jgi:4-hydroxy-tetrahydrodipicolinate synthase